MAAWLRDAGFTVEAHMLTGPDENVPGALLFSRRPPAATSRIRAAFGPHPGRPSGVCRVGRGLCHG